MLSSVGRPRQHDERTAASLLAAAERIVQDQGLEALSVRGVAAEVGTTTRAVYSLYGAKEGLVAALAAHGFDFLRDGIEQLPTTAQADRDLVECGLVFRRYALAHPSLFRMAFHSDPSPLRATASVRTASKAALDVLKRRIARVERSGLLGDVSIDEATLHFHAMCEGLAGLELRGIFPKDAERHWRQGLQAVVHGLASPQPAHPSPRGHPGPAAASRRESL